MARRDKRRKQKVMTNMKRGTPVSFSKKQRQGRKKR